MGEQRAWSTKVQQWGSVGAAAQVLQEYLSVVIVSGTGSSGVSVAVSPQQW